VSDPIKLRELATAAATEADADILIINSDMSPPADVDVVSKICSRRRRENVVVILVSSGGAADVAYRIARALQNNYKQVSIVISGWCKSAGTILCTCAHQVIFGPHGELGPIDVQIRREDEIGERDSGLSVDAAFDSLSRATFRLFETFMLDIKDHSYGSITFRTAAEIASSMAVGLVSPIFGQLDPIKIGETHRSVRIAEEYARRLAVQSRNLRRVDGTFDAVDVLLKGYPSHSFVIDYREAQALFERVEQLDGELAKLVTFLGELAMTPQDIKSGQTPVMEFLNDEPQKPEVEAAANDEQAADQSGSAAAPAGGLPTGNAEETAAQ
jgi:hypothetical protein